MAAPGVTWGRPAGPPTHRPSATRRQAPAESAEPPSVAPVSRSASCPEQPPDFAKPEPWSGESGGGFSERRFREVESSRPERVTSRNRDLVGGSGSAPRRVRGFAKRAGPGAAFWLRETRGPGGEQRSGQPRRLPWPRFREVHWSWVIRGLRETGALERGIRGRVQREAVSRSRVVPARARDFAKPGPRRGEWKCAAAGARFREAGRAWAARVPSPDRDEACAAGVDTGAGACRDGRARCVRPAEDSVAVPGQGLNRRLWAIVDAGRGMRGGPSAARSAVAGGCGAPA